MARHSYKTRTVNGYTYYYKRVYTQDGYKNVYGKTVAEVDRKAKAYRQEVEARLNQSDAPFGRFLRDYLDNVHFEGKSPVTIDTYNQLYKYVVRSKLAKKRLKNLLPEDIDGFYQDLIKSGKSADVCKNINKIVRPCLRYAFKTRRIALDLGNMITLTKAKRRKRPEQRPFTAEEQHIFEKAAEGSKYYELFITDLYTGLRRGEILALTWRDINFAAASITVDKAVKYIRDPQTGHKHFVTGDTKTETSVREIYVPQALIRLLVAYHEKQTAYFAGMGIAVDDDFLVFCSSVGSVIS